MDLARHWQPLATSPDGAHMETALSARGTPRYSRDELNHTELRALIWSKSTHLGVSAVLTFLLLLRFSLGTSTK